MVAAGGSDIGDLSPAGYVQVVREYFEDRGWNVEVTHVSGTTYLISGVRSGPTTDRQRGVGCVVAGTEETLEREHLRYLSEVSKRQNADVTFVHIRGTVGDGASKVLARHDVRVIDPESVREFYLSSKSPVPDPVAPPSLPDLTFEDLEKGDRVGVGGDADVYRATVTCEGRQHTVAVKEPRFEGTIHTRVVEEFQAEAETWSTLDAHDNVVSVHGWGTEPLPWLALEFMDGGTLDAKLGSVEIDEALWLAGRIAEGVRHGHRHGVAHLDVKPTNVLLRETGAGTWDYPKVSDWGLAKLLLEHSNSVEGISPQYAAPEQFDADEFGRPDDITDIYQLGTVVYALLTGGPPFDGSSTSVMQSVIEEMPPPPSETDPAVPSPLDEVVLRALQKDKANRYDGILTFRKELDRAFEEYADDATDETRSPEVPTPDPSDGTRAETSGSVDSDRAVGSSDAEYEPGDEDSFSGLDTESAASGGGSAKPSGSGQSQARQASGDSLLTRRRAVGIMGLGVLGAGSLLTGIPGGDGVFPGGPSDPNTTTLTAAPPATPVTRRSPTTQTGARTGTGTRDGTEKTTAENSYDLSVANTPGSSVWPSFQHDAGNSGAVPKGKAPAAQPSVEWEFSLEAKHATPPIATEDRLYVGSRTDKRDGAVGRITALDRSNGKRLWTRVFDHLVVAAPAVADGTVYVGTHEFKGEYHSPRFGKLYALDGSSGEIKWQTDPEGGVTTPLTVADGTVYFGTKGSDSTYLQGTAYAVSARDGTVLWKQVLGWGTFSAPAVSGDLVYLESRDKNHPFYALDRSDGKQVWTYTPPDFKGQPTLADGTVYITGWRDAARVVALNAGTGTEQWVRKPESEVKTSPVVVDGTVYYGTKAGLVAAVAAADGEAVWTDTVAGKVIPSPVVVGTTLYVTTLSGVLHAYDATSGEKQWQYDVSDAPLTSPVVVGGRIFLGDATGTVYALGS